MAIKKKKNGTTSSDEQQVFVNNAAGIIEAGFLMAAADGELHDDEITTLASLISSMAGGAIEEKQIEEILSGFAEDLDRDGFDARMAQVGKRLTTDSARVGALKMAAAVLFTDGAVDEESEGGFYFDLAEQLGVSREQAEQIGEEVAAKFED